jgi:hypothetical protein
MKYSTLIYAAMDGRIIANKEKTADNQKQIRQPSLGV